MGSQPATVVPEQTGGEAFQLHCDGLHVPDLQTDVPLPGEGEGDKLPRLRMALQFQPAAAQLAPRMRLAMVEAQAEPSPGAPGHQQHSDSGAVAARS